MFGSAVAAFILGVGSLVAQATFSSTIGLGSLLVGMLVVILWGVFSLRDRRNSGWKDLYEQEREKNSNLQDEKEQERIDRHAVKDQLAETKAQLEIERSKPDLAVIIEQQRELWAESTNALVSQLQAMQKTQIQMLELLTPEGRITR